MKHLRLGDRDVVLLLLLDHHRGELLLAALHLLKLNRIVVVFVEMWRRRLLLNFGGVGQLLFLIFSSQDSPYADNKEVDDGE